MIVLAALVVPAYALATADRVVVYDAKGETLADVAVRAKTLEWSPDGQTLAILGDDGALTTLRPGEKPVALAEGASEPRWAPDGRLLYTRGATGIMAVQPGTPPVPVAPTAHSPAPDGERLAFATDGAQGGLWVAKADGSAARRLLRGAATGGVSWSYDGRWLAAVVDGRLRLVRPNGLSTRDLGPVAGPGVGWSPGAPTLLAQRAKGWSVYDDLKDDWTDVQFDRAPRWSGPGRLIGVLKGQAVETTLGGPTLPYAGDARDVRDVAPVVGIFRGASFPNRFAAAPRPGRGQWAWQGRVLSADPIGGAVIFAVETDVDARGRETTFARPVVRRAFTPAGPLTRRLAVLPETEAWLVVNGNRVVDAFLPDVPTVPAPPPRARPTRPRLPTEYDGITREKVVAPIVYPIPGRHRLVDTFLDPRGGGTRRHHGNDLMAPKMTPLLAVFDGVVWFGRTKVPGASNSLTLRSDLGWTASYLHINNDTPRTDDGLGSLRYAFPADLQPGDRVRAGQVVAWCGDSGNAEDVGAHLHLELYDEDGGAIVDPFYSLKAAQRLPAPRYPDPDPTLRAGRGELRWDGVVISVDRTKRVAAVELTGIGAPGRAPARNVLPRVVYFVAPPGLTFGYRGADLAYPLDAVQPGMRVSGLGAVQGARMKLRRASMSLASE